MLHIFLTGERDIISNAAGFCIFWQKIDMENMLYTFRNNKKGSLHSTLGEVRNCIMYI